MENLHLQTWQSIVLAILYVGYLCWVMFGGMRRRKVKPLMYIIMTALMILGVVQGYTGVHGWPEVVNIAVILAIGLIKGIILGRRKIVEKIDGVWYMHHDGKYIIIWVAFFALKVVSTTVLQVTTGSHFPAWHMILYFCFYYPWRTVNVFIHNPQMRKEVLGNYKKKLAVKK